MAGCARSLVRKISSGPPARAGDDHRIHHDLKLRINASQNSNGGVNSAEKSHRQMGNQVIDGPCTGQPRSLLFRWSALLGHSPGWNIQLGR
jgi:hypothetical protein